MIQDQDFIHSKSGCDIVTREMLNDNPQMDCQGLQWLGNDRENQFFLYTENYEPCLQVLEQKLEYPRCFRQTNRGIFDFNCFYAVEDVSHSHIQMHQCCVAITEKDILYTSNDGVSIFNAVTGKSEGVLQAEEVESISYSRRLNIISGSANDEYVYVYDMARGELTMIGQLFPENTLVNGSIFIDGTVDGLLVNGNHNELIHLDLEKLAEMSRVSTLHYVNQMAYCESNKMVALAMDHQTVQIRSLADRQCDVQLVGHDDFNLAVQFMGEYQLATGGHDCTARIWDMRKTDKQLYLLDGYSSGVGAFCWEPERKTLVCCELFGYVYAYNFQEAVIRRKTFDFFSSIPGLSLGPSRQTLFAALADEPGIVKFNLENV